MKRYRFLLLAFFLTNNAIANVNSTPDLRSNNKNTSPRNISEVGSAVEPAVSGTKTQESQLIINSNGSRHAPATKTTTASANNMSCKTYEGKIYDQGEAGYSDCMRNIKTDRQGMRTVP